MKLSLAIPLLLAVFGGCAGPEISVRQAADFTDRLLDRHAASIVSVRYYFKNDAQGRPAEFPVSFFCPECDGLHMAMAQQLVAEQRPFITPGFVVAPDQVIASDIRLRPEWLDRIEIAAPDGMVTAEITAFYPEQRSVLLTSSEELPGAVPFEFAAETPGERLFDFHLVEEPRDRVAGVAPHKDGRVAEILATGYRTLDFTPVNVVVVNAAGDPVRLSMSYETPFNQRSTAAPEAWERRDVGEGNAIVDRVLEEARRAVWPVKLRFAAPDDQPAPPYMRNRNDAITELDGIAVALASGEVIIPQQLSPDLTARLDRIEIITPDGIVPAEFIASLRDLAVFRARPLQPLPGAGLAVYAGDIRDFYSREVVGVVLRSFGEELSFRGRFVPVENLAGAFGDGLVIQSFSAGDCNMFFTAEGELLGLANYFRKDGGIRGSGVVPAAALLADAGDPRNVPRPPERRRETAWFGVTLQGLDANLAQALGIAAATRDGAMGLAVTKVYPGSPADELGIRVGDVLMAAGSAESAMLMPLSGYYFSNEESGIPLWEHYDEIPQEYFDQLPKPWPAVHSMLNTMLFGVGIGEEAGVVWLSGGELHRARFRIPAAPPSYDTASRYQARNIGLSVADLTFEVRDYFRMADDDPGVIVSRVRAGSKAAVAGLKPYELILSVNDIPVRDIGEFRELTEAGGEIRLEVRRLAQNRIVTINP